VSIEFTCDQCGHMLKVNKAAIGRRVRCPGCATMLTVPAVGAGSVELIDDLEILPDEEPIVEEEEEAIAQPPPPIEPPAAPPIIAPPIHAAPPRTTPTRSVSEGFAPPRTAKPRKAAAKSPPADEPPLLPPHRPHPDDLIDMTAMVDIVFFLLIFFLVTSLQALESVMNMPTPQSAGPGVSAGKTLADLENDPNYITVRIEDDDSIWVEDTQVFNDQDLNIRLRAARKAADGPRSLLVIGDPDASHGAAVRVFDAGAGAGVNGISLLVQEKTDGAQ